MANQILEMLRKFYTEEEIKKFVAYYRRIEKCKRWNRNNPKKRKSYQKKKIDSLGDSYIRGLCISEYNLATPELIELKRASIKLKRTLKEFKKWRCKHEQSDCQNV